nr:hypothetical protein [uncultured bacterium]
MTPNEEQTKLWNGPAGQAWVDAQELLDGMFEPFERMLADEAAGLGARRVLDVGCGAGGTTLALTRRLGSGARVEGIDLSEPLIALARQRASREGLDVAFTCADAQTHDFPAGAFDLVASRFGVMFFDDFPAAFRNLRRASASGAHARLLVFRSPAENPFMTAAERAAAPLVPDLPPRKPGAPGQFALADRARVESLLGESGWRDVELRPLDVECRFPAAALDTYMMRLGPLGLYVSQLDAATRGRIVSAVRGAFTEYRRGEHIVFTACCWLVCARAP